MPRKMPEPKENVQDPSEAHLERDAVPADDAPRPTPYGTPGIGGTGDGKRARNAPRDEEQPTPPRDEA